MADRPTPKQVRAAIAAAAPADPSSNGAAPSADPSLPEEGADLQSEEAGSTCPPPVEPSPAVEVFSQTDLDNLIALSREYRHLEGSVDHIAVTLAVPISAAVDPCVEPDPANNVEYAPGGEPLWVMLLDPSSGGKTENIRLTDDVVDERIGDLTLAGLLSAKERKQRGAPPIMQQSGLLVRRQQRNFTASISDLSTMLSNPKMSGSNKDTVYAALRCVFDGYYEREMQAVKMEWWGKGTFLLGCTPAIDSYGAFLDSLGTRYLYHRMPGSDHEGRKAMARMAANRKAVESARRAAKEQATDIIHRAQTKVQTVELNDAMLDLISIAATFTGYGRVNVVREHWARYEVSAPVFAEYPGRAAHELQLLARSLLAMELDEVHVRRIVRDTALDSMPADRGIVLRHVGEQWATGQKVTPYSVTRDTDLGRKPAGRALDDFHALGVFTCNTDIDRDDGPVSFEDDAAKKLYWPDPAYEDDLIRLVTEGVAS